MDDAHPPMKQRHCAGDLLIGTLIASFAFVAVGCATRPSPPTQETDSMLLEVKLIDSLGHTVSTQNTRADPTLALGAISGEIRGNVGPTLQYIHLADPPPILIDTKVLRTKLAKDLTTETDDFLISGFSIEPADTRFARISTSFMNRGARVYGMVAGFIDPDSENALALFYFDRPCHLTGVLSVDPLTPSPTTYDVTVEKPGFTWLVGMRQDDAGIVMRAADEHVRKMFVAAPSSNIKDGRFQIR